MTRIDMLVTGASSGIGKAIYDHYRDAWTGSRRTTVVGIGLDGPDFKCDFRSHHTWQWGLSGYLNSRGTSKVTHLINCAGIMPLDERDSSCTARRVMDVNFWAPHYLTDLLLPYLDDGRSTITNICSTSGLRPERDIPIYSASKAALLSLTVSLAKQLAPRGIRVNSISPGLFDTNIVPGDTPQELIDKALLKREAQPNEIIPAIDLLLVSQYMTGSNIVIDGGIQWNM